MFRLWGSSRRLQSVDVVVLSLIGGPLRPSIPTSPRFGTTTLTSMGLVINNSVRQIPGPSILGMGTLAIHFGNYTRQSKCTVASLGSVPKLGNPSSSSPSPSPLFPLCLVVTGSFLCITNIYSWSPHGKAWSTSLSSCHASTYYSAMEKTGPRRSPPYETHTQVHSSKVSRINRDSCQVHGLRKEGNTP